MASPRSEVPGIPGRRENPWFTELVTAHQAVVQALANTWLSLFAFQLPFEGDLEKRAADIYVQVIHYGTTFSVIAVC